jgi:hypothetical protein
MTAQNLTTGKGSARQRGLITGYVWKLIRESVALTQIGLAGHLDVDLATVQAWESGRRPITALRAADLARMRMALIGLGCPPQLFEVLKDAVDADMVIDYALHHGEKVVKGAFHPLAVTVHRRDLTNLITWPFNGLMPSQLRNFVPERPKRRGPSANHPVVSASERRAFFDHLVIAAEVRREHPILHRQAVYLLSFDTDEDTKAWLEGEHLRSMGDAGGTDDVPSWVAVRSSAVSLTRYGHQDPLDAFVSRGLATHRQEIANLNYWAYWLDEIPETQVNDGFMTSESVFSWDGRRLFAHLLDRITPEADQLALNVRTLWQLVLARPNLLKERVDLRACASARVGEMLDCSDLGAQVRRELSDIAYAIRLSDR